MSLNERDAAALDVCRPNIAPARPRGSQGRRHDNLVATVAIVLVAIDLRPGIVSIGPILPAIRGHFSLSHASAALLTAIPNLLMGLLALPTPWLAHRFGRDAVQIAALTLLLVATGARAFAPNAGLLLFATGGVGAGIAVSGTLIAGFVKANFPGKSALLMGTYAMALSLGSTVSAALTGPISTAAPDGWRVAAGMWAVPGVLAIAAWLTVARGKYKSPTAETQAKVTLPWRNKTAWRVALFFACVTFLFFAIVSWAAPLYSEAGVSTTTSGLILAIFTLVFTVASFVFGWLSRSEDRRGWLLLCSLLTVVALVWLAVAPMAEPLVAVSIGAVGLGGGFTLGMTLPLDNTSTAEEANSWNAFVMTVGYLIAALGPLSVGASRDVSHSFTPGLWLLVGVGAMMVGLTLFLRPAHREEQNLR